MAISPFSARPASPGSERRRARLVLAIAALGIIATLLAYAISPGVRHVVSHAAHSVKHAVGNVFDHDKGSDDRARTNHKRLHLVQPLLPRHGALRSHHANGSSPDAPGSGISHGTPGAGAGG